MRAAGPAEDVKAFLKELEAEDVFNRALDTNGVPYHSSVLQPLLPELTECMCPGLSLGKHMIRCL